MARAKNKPAKPAEEETQTAAVVEETPAADPPIVSRKHRVVEEWTERKPLEEEDEYEEEEEEEEPVEVKPVDPIEAVIEELGVPGANWSIYVSRLPRYFKDGRSDPRSRKHCGQLSANDPDYITDQQYLPDVQRLWARAGEVNCFHLELRRNGKMRANLGVFEVEPPVIENPAAAPGQPAQIPAPLAVQPQNFDPMRAFREQMRLSGEMLNTFKDFIQPAPPPKAEVSEEVAALKFLLKDEDTRGEFISGIKRNLGLGDSGEVTLLGLISNVVTQPAVANGIGQLLAAIAGAMAAQSSAAMQGAQPLASSVALPPSAPYAPPPPSPVMMPQPPQQQIQPEQAMFNYLLSQLAQNAPTEGVADAILNQVEEYEPLQLWVDGIINTPPTEILAWVATQFPQAAEITRQPHAVEWLTNLQTHLAGDDNEDKEAS